MRSVILALLACLSAGQAMAQTRVELPIRETVLSDGVRRYSVPVEVGGVMLQAALDTGSTGLRLLPGSGARLSESGRRDSYSFGAGIKVEGVIANAALALGEIKGQTSLQSIKAVSCVEEMRECAATRTPLSQFGLEGDGLAAQGFPAILGLNTARVPIGNPLQALGVKRWIVELPRPGDTAPGRLILNPSAEDIAGFVILPFVARLNWQSAGVHDSVDGCLKTAGAKPLCGPVMLDTGAVNIGLINTGVAAGFADKPQATLTLDDTAASARVAIEMPLGRRDLATRISPRADALMPRPTIVAGLAPYFAWDVYYDADHSAIGFRPRPKMAEGPQALAAP